MSCESAAPSSSDGEKTQSGLEQAKNLVQGELRRLIEHRDPSTRAVASWSWLAIASVHLNGQIKDSSGNGGLR
jgi:hypothetical protein